VKLGGYNSAKGSGVVLEGLRVYGLRGMGSTPTVITITCI